VKKFIIIQVDVDDKNEHNCHKECRFLESLYDHCKLFDTDLCGDDEKYKRCKNCLGSSVGV